MGYAVSLSCRAWEAPAIDLIRSRGSAPTPVAVVLEFPGESGATDPSNLSATAPLKRLRLIIFIASVHVSEPT